MMNVDWSGLRDAVEQMGDVVQGERIDFEYKPSPELEFFKALKGGIEIDIGDLDDPLATGGLLGYQSAQVLLYIKAAYNSPAVIATDATQGPRFHLAECRTIRDMRAQNRIDRYVVTNDLSGRFSLVKRDDESDAAVCRLLVCQNCLKHLNYKNARYDRAGMSRLVGQFDLAEFFSTYSTLFSDLGKIEGLNDARRPPSPEELEAIRGAGCRCHECRVQLLDNVDLLTAARAHEASRADTRILCADCRRKPPSSEHVAVPRDAMVAIVAGRREQWDADPNEYAWADAFRYADQAFHGLMKIYERQGYEVPEPGLELADSSGAVTLELGLAWSGSKHAVVLGKEDATKARQLGWDVMTLGEALLDSQQDG